MKKATGEKGWLDRYRAWSSRPLSKLGVFALATLVCAGPFVLFYKPYDRIFVHPIIHYRLQSDDFAYIAASRTLPRAIASLLVPHNAHIVPSWRLTTWVLIAVAGKLSRIPEVFGIATYGVLVALMLFVGKLVARETGRGVFGLLSACAIGTTSIQFTAGTWYSAGQTLWAGLGIVATLWFAQSYRLRGHRRDLVLCAIMAWVAGGYWTIGHAAGPTAAAYLWFDPNRSRRRTAWVPLASSILAVSFFFTFGGKALDVTVSTNGRTALEAIRLDMGFWHTVRAIPENLIFGNLGQNTLVNQSPGLVLTASLVLAWAWSRRSAGRILPLEGSGVLLMFLSYYVEMSFRGYSPYTSIRGWVPWYEAIPHLGLVVWISGWAQACSDPVRKEVPYELTRRGGALVLGFVAALLLLHTPRADQLFNKSVPAMSEEEWRRLPVPSLQRLRSAYLLTEESDSQRKHLARYEQAERIARELGIGRETIKKVFGWVAMPELPKAYNAADMLDIPEQGPQEDPLVVRRALDVWLEYQPAPEHLPKAVLLKIPPRR